jgi:hypothetical protein
VYSDRRFGASSQSPKETYVAVVVLYVEAPDVLIAEALFSFRLEEHLHCRPKRLN